MRRIFVVPTVFFILSVTGSCIKENRSECPCYVILEFGEVDNSSFPSSFVDLRGATDFRLNEFVDDYAIKHVYKVSRGTLYVNVFYETDGVQFNDMGVLSVEEGREFPELWLYNSVLNASGDVCTDTVRLHKCFSCLDIHMLSYGKPVNFDLDLDGQVCGYTVSGEPEDGVFRVSLRPDDNGDCSVRVPRQKDNSLGLSIVDDGDVLRRFALGEYIVRSGFDWTREDLEDIDVTIDFTKTSLNIELRNWDTSYSFEIEI